MDTHGLGEQSGETQNVLGHHETCPFHAHIEKEQQIMFNLIGKRVPLWVFTTLVTAAVGIFSVLIIIQFGLISGIGNKFDTISATMTNVQINMVEVKSKVNEFDTKLESFKDSNETRMDSFNRDIMKIEDEIKLLRQGD